MKEYVEELMLQIEEKNVILDSVNNEGNFKNSQVKKLTRELDCLLYEFYKSMIYYVPKNPEELIK